MIQNVIRALSRLPSPALPACELTHIDREPIDLARANAQHAAYCAALTAAGATVTVLPPLADDPDSCFVEDTTVYLVVSSCCVRAFVRESRCAFMSLRNVRM